MKTLIEKWCQELGTGYVISNIDGGLCIQRIINQYYDIEITGVDNNKIVSPSFDVYIWRIQPYYEIVDKIYNIKSISELKSILQMFIIKYQDLT